MRPLQILHVCPVYSHQSYRAAGVSKAAFDLAYGLAEEGHEVRFVCPLVELDGRFDRPPEASWCDGRLKIYYVTQAKNTRFGTSHHGISAALKPHLGWAQVAHIHAFFSPWVDRAIACCRASGLSYVIQPHGKLSPEMLASRGGAKSFYLKVRGAKMLRDAGSVVLLADPIAESVREWDSKIVTRVCPNGLDSEEYSKVIAPSPLDGPYILYFGMLDPRKRLDLLIDAFAVASPEIPQMRLALVGGDHYGKKKELVDRIKSHKLNGRVVMPGHVSGDEKLRWLQHAELFVLSSEAEGLSIAMLEALASGVPCLLSVGCNAPEVEEVGAGQTVTMDTESWALAMANWSQDEERCKAASLAAKKLFEDRYTIRGVAKTMSSFYREALT